MTNIRTTTENDASLPPGADLSAWIGRSEQRNDLLASAPLAGLSATLDRADPPAVDGEALPPLAHWLYFLPVHRQSELAADGHAKRGSFLPPVALPRRMWAGGRLEFHRSLTVGAQATRTSRIARIEAKRGRSGDLVFVQVDHEIGVAGGLAVREEQDIVYRDAPASGPSRASAASGVPGAADTGGAAGGAEPPGAAEFERTVEPDPVLLFRYSALTFNGHRIHYDREYAAEEGYPGLIVHGPLIATLLVDLLRRAQPDLVLSRFEFRALRPLFDDAPFRICGRADAAGSWQLWAETPDGAPAMLARATSA